jgi:hypothetical protein
MTTDPSHQPAELSGRMRIASVALQIAGALCVARFALLMIAAVLAAAGIHLPSSSYLIGSGSLMWGLAFLWFGKHLAESNYRRWAIGMLLFWALGLLWLGAIVSPPMRSWLEVRITLWVLAGVHVATAALCIWAGFDPARDRADEPTSG